MSSKSNVMTMKFSDVVPNKLSFTNLEENTRSKGQRIAFPRYDGDKPLLVQLPWILMDTMGVPSICEYYPDDSKRDFVKIPLDQNIPEIKELTQKLIALDEHVGSTEMREKIFGDKASKYEYQPIIRTQEEQEDTKKDAKYKRPFYPYYMKIKLDTSYPDYKVKTEVFLSEMKEDKRTRTKLDVDTIDAMAKQLWLHKIRAVVQGVKLWAQPPNKKAAGYGLTFKMKRVEVEPTRSGGTVKSVNSDAFLDSDNEEEDVAAKPAVSKSVAAKPAAAKVVANEESDDAESDEEVVAPKTVKQVASDSESDDEVVVAKKPAAKKPVKQVASDSDESDDEVVVAKKPAKGKFSVSSTKSKKASA